MLTGHAVNTKAGSRDSAMLLDIELADEEVTIPAPKPCAVAVGETVHGSAAESDHADIAADDEAFDELEGDQDDFVELLAEALALDQVPQEFAGAAQAPDLSESNPVLAHSALFEEAALVALAEAPQPSQSAGVMVVSMQRSC